MLSIWRLNRELHQNMQEEAKCFSFLIFFKFTFDSLVTHSSYMSDVYGALIREKVGAQQVKYK